MNGPAPPSSCQLSSVFIRDSKNYLYRTKYTVDFSFVQWSIRLLCVLMNSGTPTFTSNSWIKTTVTALFQYAASTTRSFPFSQQLTYQSCDTTLRMPSSLSNAQLKKKKKSASKRTPIGTVDAMHDYSVCKQPFVGRRIPYCPSFLPAVIDFVSPSQKE